jgi:hypothetical protein
MFQELDFDCSKQLEYLDNEYNKLKNLLKELKVGTVI